MLKAKASLIIYSLILLGCLSCIHADKKTSKKTEDVSDWKYFGQEYPGTTPVLYSPGIISTQRNERDFAVSPDGTEIYYSYALPGFNLSTIICLKHDGAFWSDLGVARFSGKYNDLEPAFAPDGNTLFFISQRPVNELDSTHDWNLWFMERMQSGWSDPKAVGMPVNDEGNEYYPSVAINGNLYFTASRDDSYGGEDIYYSEKTDNQYMEPVNLGEGVNSSLPEFNAFISPDEQFLVFSSMGREDGLGGGDLYISYRDADGIWQKSTNLGPGINSDKLDYCPFVTYDRKYLFFTSERINSKITDHKKKNLAEIMKLDDSFANGSGDIYWIEFEGSGWK